MCLVSGINILSLRGLTRDDPIVHSRAGTVWRSHSLYFRWYLNILSLNS